MLILADHVIRIAAAIVSQLGFSGVLDLMIPLNECLLFSSNTSHDYSSHAESVEPKISCEVCHSFIEKAVFGNVAIVMRSWGKHQLNTNALSISCV